MIAPLDMTALLNSRRRAGLARLRLLLLSGRVTIETWEILPPGQSTWKQREGLRKIAGIVCRMARMRRERAYWVPGPDTYQLLDLSTPALTPPAHPKEP